MVKKGIWTTNKRQVEAAVKVVRSMARPELEEEARVMTKLKHPNIVEFFGFCPDYSPGAIVMEFLENGSLKSYVSREKSNLRNNVTFMIELCLDVAQGMSYLERKGYIHRDLAARNCLVNRDNYVKVADFGLIRRAKEGFRLSYDKPIPFRWAAPEILLGNPELRNKCDVWAFGVTLWEVFSFGLLPYGSPTRVSNYDVEDSLVNGQILGQPQSCPENVNRLMVQCFQWRPRDRPSFATICTKLQQLLEGGKK